MSTHSEAMRNVRPPLRRDDTSLKLRVAGVLAVVALVVVGAVL